MEASSFRSSARCSLLALAAGAWTLSAYADGMSALPEGDKALCPIEKVNTERLPELNIPRAGHNMFYAGDELTVVGGHTIGFKPTATAEYYKDGQWHQLPTAYPHDNGLAVPLRPMVASRR